MVIFVSSDNEQFTIDKDAVKNMGLITNMSSEIDDQSIPLPNITSAVLKKILEYCEHHHNDPVYHFDNSYDEFSAYSTRRRTSDISEWDYNFFSAIDTNMITEIVIAANYLDFPPLLDAGCKTIANMIKGKTPEEIRKIFNIENDFTPEEEVSYQYRHFQESCF
ncbi:Skp1 family, dimerization domain-containing protein [Cyathus striatus]|nr:Skp1 family, dimerization domain-containing protein [Cyathus striatus]